MWTLLEDPIKPKEQRTVFVDTLQNLIDINPRIIVLEADLGGASTLNRIKNSHPDNYVQMGIAEANMVGVAAGLSMRGFIPFIHTFTPFISRRACDQLFMAGAYSKNTINIYASDPGICATTNGGTHTSMEDLGFMRALPEALIFDPADGIQLEWLIRELVHLPGIHYIRTTRKNIRPVYAPGSTFKIGKGNIIIKGTDILIIAMGQLLSEALDAAEILSKEGISTEVIDMFTIKPLDRELIIQEAAGKKLVITCENHSIINGLGSAVADVLAEAGLSVPLRKVGIQDKFGQVGSLSYLKEVYGLTSKHIAKTVIEYFGIQSSSY